MGNQQTINIIATPIAGMYNKYLSILCAFDDISKSLGAARLLIRLNYLAACFFGEGEGHRFYKN